jgi:GT2 family glycosyltransferase
LAEDLRPFCGIAPLVLYNGIDLGTFSRHTVERVPDRPVVAWVGRVADPVKGFSRFLEVVSHPSLQGWEVWVADADGVAESTEVASITGRLTQIRHRLGPDGMAAFYRQVGSSGGALLSTSTYDVAPLVLLEALACGCPVVAPRVGGIPEMLSGGRWGAFYEADVGPAEAAAVVARFVESGDHLACLRRAEAGIARGFSLDAMVRRVFEAYHTAMARPVAPAEGDLDRRAFRRWHVRSGRLRCRLSPPPTGRFSLFGVPAWLAKEIAVLAGKAAYARLRRQHEAWLKSARLLWFYVGQALEAVAPSQVSRGTSWSLGREDGVTVVVCTRNRPALLRRLLESLAECTPLPDEVLLVDQSTSSESEEVVRSYAAGCFPRAVYMRIAGKGKSRALNLAVREARGSVLLLTDDDCVVSADWVGQVRAAFRTDPELDCVMGRVLPGGEQDRRLPLSLRTAPTAKRYDSVRFCETAELGWGNNVSFRANVLRCMEGFDLSLGPGAWWPAGEDADAVYRLIKAGREAAYIPEVVVYHARHTDSYIRMRASYRAGRYVFLTKHLLRGDWWLFRRLRWELVGLARDLIAPRRQLGEEHGRLFVLRMCVVLILTLALRPMYEVMKLLAPVHRRARVTRKWVLVRSLSEVAP